MASKSGRESSGFNPFLVKDNEVDPNVNFFQEIHTFNTKYYSPSEVKQIFKSFNFNFSCQY